MGSALALLLHRAGRRVLLVDADGSKDKTCGEGLLPGGWQVLETLGLAETIEVKAAISTLCYRHFNRAGELQSMQAPLTRPAFGVARAHLCQAFARALENEGVEVWRGARFRELAWTPQSLKLSIDHPQRGRVELQPRVLVGADGLHSRVRRQAQLESPARPRYHRWGSRVYFHSQEQRQGVEVTLGDGLESYLTPLGGSLHGLAFLWSPQELGRPLPGEGPLWSRLLDRFPPQFLEQLPPKEQFFGSNTALGPLQQLVSSPLHTSQKIVLVGDASGYLDALTGEGMCLGLQQAQVLAKLMLAGRVDRYPLAYWRLKLRHRLVVHGLLWLLSQPRLRERVFSALQNSPQMFAAVIGVAVESRPPWELLNRGLLPFLRPLVLPHARAGDPSSV